MTTPTGQFIISDDAGDLISIADRPNHPLGVASPYHTLILDALRNQQSVRHVSPDPRSSGRGTRPEDRGGAGAPAITPTPITVKKPRAAALPAPKAGKHRVKKATSPATATPATPAAEEKKSWAVGDIVFIAWRTLTSAERETFDDIREAMGTIETIQRGRGIRRTVGVKWDARNSIEWHHPNDLSSICEYCHDERGLNESAEENTSDE